MSFVWNLIKPFAAPFFVAAAFSGVVWVLYDGNLTKAKRIAELEVSNRQLVQAIEEQEKAKAELRADIKLRDDIGLGMKEWKDGLDKTIREAGAILERDAGYATWGNQPVPDSVYSAIELLEKDGMPSPGNR